MPGLSRDPDKAQRQRDGLAKGRVTQARRLLGLDDDAPPGPAAPTAPPATPKPIAGQLDIDAAASELPVHTYPEIPDAPTPEPEQEPATLTDEPEQRRRGGFFDGLRAGFSD